MASVATTGMRETYATVQPSFSLHTRRSGDRDSSRQALGMTRKTRISPCGEGAPPAEQRSIVFVNGTPTEFGARRVPRLFTKTFDVDGRAISTPTTNRSESSGLSPVTGLTGRALDAARTSKRRAEACQ